MLRYDVDHLVELYKVAVDEYRFEVKLGWDRMKYYLVLNTAIVSIGIGLLQLKVAWFLFVPVASVFAIGIATASLGIRAIKTAHDYYRRSVYKKTLIEETLGLGSRIGDYPYEHATLAIATTQSQSERNEILYKTTDWLARPLRQSSVVYSVTLMLRLVAFINLAGALISLYLAASRYGDQPYIPWP